MSYILDALKRADAERERGTVPGLRAQTVPGVTPESHGAHARLRAWPMIVTGIALAVAVIAAGAWVWRSQAGSDRAPVVVAAAPTVPAVPAAPALPPQPAPVAAPAPAASGAQRGVAGRTGRPDRAGRFPRSQTQAPARTAPIDDAAKRQHSSRARQAIAGSIHRQPGTARRPTAQ